MKYAYQRQGSGILDWNRAPPQQSRAADSKALGSLGGDTLGLGALELPRPGAPEPLSGLQGHPGRSVRQSDGGFRHPSMGCSSCTGMGADNGAGLGALEKPLLIAGGIAGLYYLYKKMKKKR